MVEESWQVKNARLMVETFNASRLYVEILVVNHYDFIAPEPAIFGVNWSALGTVSVEDAKEFVDRINAAIVLCKVLTELKISNREW